MICKGSEAKKTSFLERYERCATMELLRSYTLRCLLVCAAVLVVCPNMALGDDPCVEAPRIGEFAASLPQVTAKGLRQGAFRLTESGRQFAISYFIRGKAGFRSSLPQSPDRSRAVTPIRVGGYSGLFVRDSYGRIQCNSIIFPSLTTGRFRALSVGNVYGVPEDIDADGDTEFVILEEQAWVSNCDFPNCCRPVWHRVSHLSPQTGKLVDVSDRFPQHYAALAREYRKDPFFEGLSPHCQQSLQEFINEVEAKAGKARRNDE